MNLVKVNGSKMSLHDLRKDMCSLQLFYTIGNLRKGVIFQIFFVKMSNLPSFSADLQIQGGRICATC